MTDDHRRRRDEPERSMTARLARLEERQMHLAERFAEHVRANADLHRDNQKLISALDARADRQDLMFARLMAGLAALVFIGQLVAPVILRSFGVES